MKFKKPSFKKFKLGGIQKKQIFVLGGLLCMLLITGYANFKFNTSSLLKKNKGADKAVSSGFQKSETKTTSTGDFFADFRADRQRIREKELEGIESVINDGNTEKDVLAKAQQQKLSVSEAMEKETTIEGLLKAKGFSEAVVTIRENSINVVVEETEIDEKKAAQILEIVQRETGEDSQNIKVLPKS
ncbi:MAG: SpoIIIAH-like family protein [Clostridia bacterium]|nr:SpoIIIAH-like family protein [Clostridia bacterium]